MEYNLNYYNLGMSHKNKVKPLLIFCHKIVQNCLVDPAKLDEEGKLQGCSLTLAVGLLA